MKIELKSIKHSPSMSEETEAFTAELYLNGKKAGFVRNDGRGGCTDYQAYKDYQTMVRLAEEHAKTLPPIKYDDFEINSNLENVIDCLFDDWLKAKDLKKAQTKLNKLMLTNVCIGRDVTNYTVMSWKSQGKVISIDILMKSEQGRKLIKEKIDTQAINGKILLNTNIDLKMLK